MYKLTVVVLSPSSRIVRVAIEYAQQSEDGRPRQGGHRHHRQCPEGTGRVTFRALHLITVQNMHDGARAGVNIRGARVVPGVVKVHVSYQVVRRDAVERGPVPLAKLLVRDDIILVIPNHVVWPPVVVVIHHAGQVQIFALVPVHHGALENLRRGS
uniref:(northern house mosquito) hypothetical protein n=1 Tax=Culex pipiens TaxID=7175 RepID=A0A8D8CZ41_CULPI